MTAYIIAPCIAHSQGRNTDACTISVLIRKSRIFNLPFYVFWNNFSTRDHSDWCMWSHQQRNVFWLTSKTNVFFHDKARYTYQLVRRLSYPDLTPNKNIYPSVEYIELLLYGNIFYYQWVLTEGYHGFMDINKCRVSSKYVPSSSFSQAVALNISPRSSFSTQCSQKLVCSSHLLNSVSHHRFTSCTQRTVVSLPDHHRFQSWYRPNGFCEIFILIWVWRNIFGTGALSHYDILSEDLTTPRMSEILVKRFYRFGIWWALPRHLTTFRPILTTWATAAHS